MNQQSTVFIDSLPLSDVERAAGSLIPMERDSYDGVLGEARTERIQSLLAEGTSPAARGFRKVERSPIGRDEHRNPAPSTRSMQALPGEMLTEWPRMHKELQQYARELQASEARFRQIIEKNADGILIVNQDGIIRFVNPAAEALFDRQAEELVGEGFGFPVTAGETTEIDIVRRPPPPAGGPEMMPSVPPVDGGGGETAVAEMRVVEIEWEGESGYLASLRDITGRKRLEAELENARQLERHLAYHDALTGLPNRLLFYDRLRQSMAQAKRHRQLAALLFLDLDGFKRINDTLGHSVGDLLLQSVAGRLCDCLRETDTVARLGGDEFTVILNDMTQAQGAATVAQKILNVLSNPYVLKGYEVVITVSIGISLYPSDGTDVESLVRSADTAMYRAKAQGKNIYQLYNFGLQLSDFGFSAVNPQSTIRNPKRENKGMKKACPEQSRRVLITGGAGFIGSHLAEYYAVQGNQVIVLDNLSRMKLLGQNQRCLTNWEFLSQFDNVKRIRGDVRDDETVAEAVTGVDVIFHCAAQTAVTRAVIDPKTDFTTNVIGTFNILEAARHAPKSPAIVFCSTNKVYGDNLNRIPLSEENSRYLLDEAYQDGIPEEFSVDGCEHTPYGCSKLASDLYMQDYARLYGLKIGVFRMSCIYGPRQFGVEDQGWVAWFVIAALLDKPITIYGDGKQVRDVLYVTDLVRAFDHFVQSDLSHLVVNIGGGPRNTLSLRELTQLLEELLGKKIHVQYADWRPSDQKVYISNIENVKTALKWKPSVSPVEGIINLLSYARANFSISDGGLFRISD